MDLELDEDQAEFYRVAGAVLNRRDQTASARAYAEGYGNSATLWRTLSDLGWYEAGRARPDGLGVAGLCLLAEQLGRTLASTLVIDTTVASMMLSTVYHDLALATIDLDDHVSVVVETAGRLSVTGTKVGVPHAANARWFGVTATTKGKSTVFVVVDAAAAGVHVTPESAVDPTASSGRVSFDQALVVDSTADSNSIRDCFGLGALATCAESVGAASSAFDLAVEHAKLRTQFGRPIGSFQAVQHLLADALVSRESAWSTVLYSASAADEGLRDRTAAANVSQTYVAANARRVVESALQVLGGVGFTWEHDLHLHLRRVLWCEQRCVAMQEVPSAYPRSDDNIRLSPTDRTA